MKIKKALLLVGLILLPVLAFAQYTGNSYDGYASRIGIGAICDTIPPFPVTDLQIITDSIYVLKLTWTAPEDNTGLQLYDIRYYTSLITEGNWVDADTCSNEPLPQPAGSTETFIVQGLLPSTHYYFALKTSDLSSNWSDISNCVDDTTSAYYDVTPPASVTDLNVTGSSLFTITVNWTAVGDDSTSGTASYYDIRYSTSLITEGNWVDAGTCSNEPLPQPAGSTETFTIYPLYAGTTYYVAMKVGDETLNWSSLSNCASGSTTESQVGRELRFNDLFPDGLVSGEQYIKFPQYYETPYQVTGFTWWGSNDFSLYFYPDNSQGLPDTTNICGYYSLWASTVTGWRDYSADESAYGNIDPIIINFNGPLWARFIPTGSIGYDTSYPDGRSYHYSGGEFTQYTDRDIMLSLTVGGVKLENDVSVETIDNPYGYIAPAMHEAVPRATIRNNGENAATFTTYCVIESNGSVVYNESVEVNALESEAITRVAFPSWSVSEEGTSYTIQVYTDLMDDNSTFNDTLGRNMTASYTETIKYTSYNWAFAASGFAGGDPSDVLTRITPSAYPAQIMEIKIFLNHGNEHQVPLKVYSDSNPADFYNFQPGSLLWNDSRPGNVGYGYNTFNISDEKLALDESDVEGYIGYFYEDWSNVYSDWNTAPQYVFPQRHALTWDSGYTLWFMNFITTVTVRYTEDGSLSGTVTDLSTLAPVENAEITAGYKTAYTDQYGNYRFENLIIGDDYMVICNAADQGYNTAYAYFVAIIVDETTDVDFALTSPDMSVEPGTINTTIGTNDSLVTYITVSNDGNGPLDYSIITNQSRDNGEKAQFSVSPQVIYGDIGELVTRTYDSIEDAEFGELSIDIGEIRDNNCAPINSEVSGWYTVAHTPGSKENRLDEWYAYGDMNALNWIIWASPERVTYFNPADFGLEYPFHITKLSHWFYEHSSQPWDDATFHFKVYAEDDITLLYESGDIEAEHMVEIIHELSSPVTITSSGFYFGVAPVSTTGFPSSCADNLYTGSNHSYYGSPGSWTLWSASPDKGEYLQSVYLSPCNKWITTEPDSGTVEPGSTDTVAVTCYTMNADSGSILNENIIFSSYPDVGSDTVSVTLTVGGELSPPENVNIEIVADGDSVKISWDNEGHTYNIYSSENPYAVFPDEWGPPVSTVINTGEVILPVPEDNKKFYCVTANNAK